MSNADSVLRELVDKMRLDLAGGEGYNYTAYEEGRIAEKRKCIHELESILAAAQAAPAGMVLVPREPTPEILRDMSLALHDFKEPGVYPRIRGAYAAMLAAAPAAQVAVPVAFASTGCSGASVKKLPALAALPYGDYHLYAGPAAAQVAKPVGTVFLCPGKNLDKTQCNFMRDDVPEGTLLYAAAPAVVVDEAMVKVYTDAHIAEFDRLEPITLPDYPGRMQANIDAAIKVGLQAFAAALGQGKAT